jgi:hypothetical protein
MVTILNNGQPVTSEAELNDAIIQADGEAANSGAFEIDVVGILDNPLTTALKAINLQPGVTLNIVGKRLIPGQDSFPVLDGGGSQRGLFVYSGTVNIKNLTIENMVARGGNGGTGAGGGGAGLGGGLFVGANGKVTLNNVTFDNDQAVGGSGSSNGGGGGGGLGGNGGDQSAKRNMCHDTGRSFEAAQIANMLRG